MTPSEASMKLAHECARGNLLHFCSNRCSSIGDDPRFDCHCIRSFATDIAILLDRVRAEALEEAKWRTIETAPKDGTPILGVYYNDLEWEYRLVRWKLRDQVYPWKQVDGSNAWTADRVTNWRPLPAPPTTNGDGE